MKRINFFFLAMFLVVTTMSLKGQTPLNIDCTGKTEVTQAMVDDAITATPGTARNNITKVTFSNADDITSIGDYAFQNCGKLAEVTFPANLQSIGDYAFWYCGFLAEVTFPAGLESIGISAFHSCSFLAEVTFPAGLESIGISAFEGCGFLAEVTFPAGLESIGDYAFQGCSSLAEVTFLSCYPPLTNDNPFNGLTGLTLEVPKGCSGNYGISPWNNYTIIELSPPPLPPPTLIKIGGDLIIKGNSKVKFGK